MNKDQRDSLLSLCLVLLWEKMSLIISYQQIVVPSLLNSPTVVGGLLMDCQFSTFRSVPSSYSHWDRNHNSLVHLFFHRPISQFPCTFCLTKKTCFPERLFLWGPFKINWSIVLCLYFCHLICKNLLRVATGILSLHVFILFCIWSFYRAA